MSYIGGGRIGEVKSSNGVNWETVDIHTVPTGEFDSLGQLYPMVNNDGMLMWFTGFNGQTYSIGYASLINGAWENQGVVLEADADSENENRAVAQMSVVNNDDGYSAWYSGYDTTQTDPGPWRIMSATSVDGSTWIERHLALDLTDTGEEAWSVREPSVALWDETLWMAYIGMGDDGQYRLRLANCE